MLTLDDFINKTADVLVHIVSEKQRQGKEINTISLFSSLTVRAHLFEAFRFEPKKERMHIAHMDLFKQLANCLEDINDVDKMRERMIPVVAEAYKRAGTLQPGVDLSSNEEALRRWKGLDSCVELE